MHPKLELVHVSPRPIGGISTTARSPGGRTLRLASATDDIGRLERVAARKLLAGSFEHARFLLLGFEGEYLFDLRQKMKSIGAFSMASAISLCQLDRASDIGLNFTHVLVNLDAFASIEAAVESLIAFREKTPDLIVVAFSEMTSGDDFGSERTAICDATLKLPVSTPRLADGLVTALLNHADAF